LYPPINNLGQVAGYIEQSGTNVVAIYNTANGTITQLDDPPGSIVPVGFAVNINGHVIADEFAASPITNAYFYNGTSWTDITLPGYQNIELTGLNDSDEVVGIAAGYNARESQSFSWTPSSGVTLLGITDFSDGSQADGINNSGVIIGLGTTNGGYSFPFVNFCGSNLDLDTIVLGPTTTRPTYYSQFASLDEATGINNNNQIVGNGFTTNSEEVGFLLPPVGQSQYLPDLPSCNCFNSGVEREVFCFVFLAAFASLWFDPPTADGFQYTMQSDALFTEIANFPTGFSNSFTVSVNGTVLGQFVPGQSVVFSNYVAQLGSALINNSGVTQFDVTGIAPLVDPQNPQGFPLEIGFNQTNVVISFSMAAIETNAPQLTIIPSGANVVLSWPSSIVGWTLQTNNNLATGTWGNYTGPVVNNTVTNTPLTGNMFFRLLLP
jgi:hypothetical protein